MSSSRRPPPTTKSSEKDKKEEDDHHLALLLRILRRPSTGGDDTLLGDLLPQQNNQQQSSSQQHSTAAVLFYANVAVRSGQLSAPFSFLWRVDSLSATEPVVTVTLTLDLERRKFGRVHCKVLQHRTTEPPKNFNLHLYDPNDRTRLRTLLSARHEFPVDDDLRSFTHDDKKRRRLNEQTKF